jgi:hypothetical protein
MLLFFFAMIVVAGVGNPPWREANGSEWMRSPLEGGLAAGGGC